MAATEHFKAAAQALANARQEKQREIDEMRASLNHQEVDVKHSTQDMNSQIRNLEVNVSNLASSNNPNENERERARLLQSIGLLRRTMSTAESDFARVRQQTLDHIKRLEQEVIGLDSLVRDLESRR